jgi:hypothetical protein
MEYYLFMGHRLARRSTPSKCEWIVNGEWTEDSQKTVAQQDALHDYGDSSIGDQDQITQEMAQELIRNGKIVLQGEIGYGTYYLETKTIQLSNWKKSNI